MGPTRRGWKISVLFENFGLKLSYSGVPIKLRLFAEDFSRSLTNILPLCAVQKI